MTTETLGLDAWHRCPFPGCEWNVELHRAGCREHDPVRRTGTEYRTDADGNTIYRTASETWTSGPEG